MVGAVLEMHSTWSSTAAISENMVTYLYAENNGANTGPIKTGT